MSDYTSVGNGPYRPSVTIAIPTYNRSRMLKQCLDRILKQIDNETEVLVVDNASTDGTPDLLKTYTHRNLVKRRNDENIGLFRNFNACLRHASGEYIVLLSDDDMIDDDFVAICKTILQDTGIVAAIAASRFKTYLKDGSATEFDLESRVPSGSYEGSMLLEQVWRGNVAIQLCGIMFRRSALAKVGGFVEDHAYSGDIYTYTKLFLGKLVGYHAFAKSTYVIHAASETSALGLAYRLKDVANVFASIKDMIATLYGKERQRILNRSINGFVSRFYMKEIFALRDHGGTKMDCLRAAFTGGRWLGGFGNAHTWAQWIFFHRVLPQWMREGLWTAQRWFAKKTRRHDITSR